MKIRDRLASLVDGGAAVQRLAELQGEIAERDENVSGLEQQVAGLEEQIGTLADGFARALSEQAQWVDPGDIASRLREQGVGADELWNLVYGLQYDTLAAFGAQAGTSDRERELAVKQSERMWRYSPQAQWATWLWTSWGLGDKLSVKCDDEQAQEWWDEFWTAWRNAPVLDADAVHANLSDWLLVKGNRFLAFYGNTENGKATIRRLRQEEITAILCDPDDASEPWFYKRDFTVGAAAKTWYYPDWRLAVDLADKADEFWQRLVDDKIVDGGAERADLVRRNGEGLGTVVCVLHVAHNRKDEDSPRGWPLATTASSWMRALRQYMEARLGVAMAKAAIVRKTTVKGGSRAVAAIDAVHKAGLTRNQWSDTNPPPVGGSWLTENEASKTEELPLSTGGADAERDWKMFGHQAMLGVGLFPTSAGMDTTRWATAVEMDKTQSSLFERYRSFWAAQVRRMARIVLAYANRYGGKSFDLEQEIAVSTDSFSVVDFPGLAKSVGEAVEGAFTPLVDGGTIPEETARSIAAELWRVLLQAIGSGKAETLTDDEHFEVGDFAPEEEEEPEEPAAAPQLGVTPPQLAPYRLPEEPTAAGEAIGRALRRLRDGAISPDQFAEFALATVGDGIWSK